MHIHLFLRMRCLFSSFSFASFPDYTHRPLIHISHILTYAPQISCQLSGAEFQFGIWELYKKESGSLPEKSFLLSIN